MLIKDKDILVQDVNSSEDAPRRPAPKGIAKEHMREAWGDAFDYYLRGITAKYLQFRGRATRLEFWGFAVASSVLYIPLYLLGYYADVPMLPYYYACATLIPTFAVIARRLHDINKRSGLYLALTAVLLGLYFVIPQYAIFPLIVWAGVMIRLLSQETVDEEGLYGERNEDDEIYGSDNQPIIAKFRRLAVMMLAIWLIATGVLFDNWSRQAEQKGTIEQILEEVEKAAMQEQLSETDIAKARTEMIKMLKKLDGQAIEKKKIQELVLQAVRNVKAAQSAAQ